MIQGGYIDTHVHILPEKRIRGLMKWVYRSMEGTVVPSFEGGGVKQDITEEEIVADIRRKGMKRFFSLVFPLKPNEIPHLNYFSAQVPERYPEAIPFGSLHIETPNKRDVIMEAMKELGLAGIKFHPMVQRFDPGDPRMLEVYETLDSLRRPLILHTGYDAFYQFGYPSSGIEAILSSYPNIPVILVHFFFPRLDYAFRLLHRFPQLMLDATNVFGSFEMEYGASFDPLSHPEADILRNGLLQFSDRILFGTDHPAGMGSVDKIFFDLERFNLPVAFLERVLYKNAEDFIEKHINQR